jgi:hypothetical protein
MKPASTMKIGITALVLLLASGLNGWAHTPRIRQVSGTIQEVNVEKHVFVVRVTEKGTLMKLVWTPDTKFFQDRQAVDGTVLKAELKVCVDYRAPFFGRPSATKVAWGDDRRP